PVFINNEWVYIHKTLGYFPNLVRVPSHFYKVIVGRKKGGGGMANVVGAFMVPNNNHVPKDVSSVCVYGYVYGCVYVT
ncbi:hypothetical protein EON63_13995, partial [archaeon]